MRSAPGAGITMIGTVFAASHWACVSSISTNDKPPTASTARIAADCVTFDRLPPLLTPVALVSRYNKRSLKLKRAAESAVTL